MNSYYDDLAQTWRDAINAFYAAGCLCLQLDDTVWAYLCSEEQKRQIRDRDEDPQWLANIYAKVLNSTLAEKPADMTVALHVRRGNFRSNWIAEGTYEPVHKILFAGVNVDAFFLEYDNQRSGSFDPRRFIRPGNQQVVLGVITSKKGELENPFTVKQRIAEVAKFVEYEQICLSPQCDFASIEEGKHLTEQQQWDKLRLVIDISSSIW